MSGKPRKPAAHPEPCTACGALEELRPDALCDACGRAEDRLRRGRGIGLLPAAQVFDIHQAELAPLVDQRIRNALAEQEGAAPNAR